MIKKITWGLILVSILILLMPIGVQAQKSLFVYCGAGFKKPMQEIGELFEQEYGIRINYQFNGSGTLSNQIKTVKSGDLYMPGDIWYINKLKNIKGAKEKQGNYIYTQAPVGYHTPVVITPDNNPGNIKEFNDLDESEVEAVLGSKSAAIGRVANKILAKSGFTLNTIAKMGTVNQVAMTVAMGQGDVGIVWRANYKEFEDKLKLVKIPKEVNVVKDLAIAVLEFSSKKEKAVKFMNFVSSEKGRNIFAKYGYRTNKN
ncbi:molybdate ABC transporter substrate-binding protein [Sporohalobacter salinus]|uniref:molybdate ABC transporter substrate-binding protein n=1 Tax=Sporohalobacter salinus TaxID=1494606 RepID=UPI001961EB2B|nr:molybdate ABC transporter substrate-binding protein [Sporohalobacter salinus]MBM7622507.1 molybdate transport system substrate-binding protein [Sporohalobacter salinus]